MDTATLAVSKAAEVGGSVRVLTRPTSPLAKKRGRKPTQSMAAWHVAARSVGDVAEGSSTSQLQPLHPANTIPISSEGKLQLPLVNDAWDNMKGVVQVMEMLFVLFKDVILSDIKFVLLANNIISVNLC